MKEYELAAENLRRFVRGGLGYQEAFCDIGYLTDEIERLQNDLAAIKGMQELTLVVGDDPLCT